MPNPTLSADALRDLQALYEKAIAGPWMADGEALFIDAREQVCCGRNFYECCGEYNIIGGAEQIGQSSPENIALTAAMHAALPALLTAAGEVEKLRAENRELSVALIDRAFASAQERVKAVESIAAVIDKWASAFSDRPDAECCTDLALQIASACATLPRPASGPAEAVAPDATEALTFAVEIDDHLDRLFFIKAFLGATQHDIDSREEWPEFFIREAPPAAGSTEG